MSDQKDIPMFLLTCLKGDNIPKDFVVFFWYGDRVEWVYLFFDGKDFICEETHESFNGTILEMVKKKSGKGKIWFIGWRLYEFLCWQGLYKQVESGEVEIKKKKKRLKTKEKDEEIEVLCQTLITGDPTIIDLTVNKHTVHCIDFINWGIVGVREDVINGEKKVIHGKSLNDAIAALMLRVSMVQKLKMGNFSDTASGQGKNCFRRNHLKDKKVYCHQVLEVRDLARKAFFAGRNEAMFIGEIKEPVWNLDIKSFYPWIVSTRPVPVKLLNYGYSLSLDDCRKMIADGLHVIALVEIKTSLPVYPLKHDCMTIYPTGHFLTPLCSPELEFALLNDHVLSIRKWAVYQTAVLFQENSQWFFNAKKSLDSLGLSVMSGPLKLSQNSMYGNMGPRGKTWIECSPIGDCKWGEYVRRNPINNEICLGRAINGVHQYLNLTGEPDKSCPEIPATVFSYGRILLWPYIVKAGFNNYFYDDTDGIMVNSSGVVNLEWKHNYEDPQPGELVLREYSHDKKYKNKTVDIRGLKHYRFGDIWRQNGVPSNAERDEFGVPTFNQHKPFDISLWHSLPFDHSYKDSKRRWKNLYKHGHVQPDCRVFPLLAEIIKDKETNEERNVIL